MKFKYAAMLVLLAGLKMWSMAVIGVAVSVLGLWITFKTLDRVYLTHGWSVNASVCYFFAGALIFWFGMAVLFYAFGLLV